MKEVILFLPFALAAVLTMNAALPVYSAILTQAKEPVSAVASTGGTAITLLGFWPFAVAAVLLLSCIALIIKSSQPQPQAYNGGFYP